MQGIFNLRNGLQLLFSFGSADQTKQIIRSMRLDPEKDSL